MRAQGKDAPESAHMGAHIGEQTYESTEETTEEHTYESTHMTMEIGKKNAGLQFRGARFVRARTWTFHKRFYKSHFVLKFTGQMPDPFSADGILYGNLREKTHRGISQEPFCVEF